MSAELSEIIEKLQSALLMVQNPLTPHPLRVEAYNLCESFKEESPHCLQCGFMMAAADRDAFVRHFGLQLIEHCVKFRWNDMNIFDKQMVRLRTLAIISEGTLGILKEMTHVKDALSRILVEMAKREWPQQWPTMIDELNIIYTQGPTQTELVLLVFLRLVEDVLTLQTVPTQRRRDILQSLTAIMPELFGCFVRTLGTSLETCQNVNSSAPEAVRVIFTDLQLLAVLLDWVNIGLILENNSLLLQLLCKMLCSRNIDVSLQILAAECLLVIACRKGKCDERKPLLILFSQDVLSPLLEAISLSFTTNVDDEQSYLFMKKLSSILAALSSLLCSIWGTTPDFSKPATFPQYLEAIFRFTQHPSHLLSSTMLAIWLSLLTHDEISLTSDLHVFIPHLLQFIRNGLVKNGYPSATNSLSSKYARLEFDTDEEFGLFFSKYRADCTLIIRAIATLQPGETLQYISRCIIEQMKQPLVEGYASDMGDLDSMSSHNLDAAMQWDALSTYLECVVARVMASNKADSLSAMGIELLKNLLQYSVSDPLILSSVLTTISSLSSFISISSDMLLAVLERVFAVAVFTVPGQNKSSRCRAVKNVRRHACSLFVKLCKQFPVLMLQHFDQLRCHIQKLSSDQQDLSTMERCTLNEGLLVVSNHFNDFAKQESFIREVLAPVKEIWLSDNIRSSLRPVEKFMTLVGLDQPAVEPSAEDTCGIWRSQIQYCVGNIQAVLKRSVCPDDPDVAKAGGFLTSSTPSGTPVMRNPATGPVFELLDNVLGLCRSLGDLWLPESLAKRHPDFAKAFDLSEPDRLIVLGIYLGPNENSYSSNAKQPVERMQSFLYTVYDSCCHILGSAGQSIGWQFYQTPNLAQSVYTAMFANAAVLPEFRLRCMIRTFLRTFIHYCPKEFYETAVLPMISRLSPIIHDRLCNAWQIVSARCVQSENGESADGGAAEMHEVLEEQITRLLTREYIDMLTMLFREKRSGAILEPSDEMATDVEMEVKKMNVESVGELGMLILQHSDVFPSVVVSLLTCLSWSDTPSCIKSLTVLSTVIKQIVTMGNVVSEHACYFMTSCIVGLHTQGQHDAVQSLLVNATLNVYEILRPSFPDITKVLLEIPSCREDILRDFDQKVFFSPTKKPPSDKKKKEIFRSLVQDAIGKNVGQQFRKESTIKNLPPLVIRTQRSRIRSAMKTDDQDIGLCTLFSPNS